MIKLIKEIKFFNPVKILNNEETFINDTKFDIKLDTETFFVEIIPKGVYNEVVYTTLYNVPYYKLVPSESQVIVRKKVK